MSTEKLRYFVRANGIAWPGCYPMYALCADSGVLCVESVRENYKQILHATRHPGTNLQWEVIGVDVHWEGEPFYCAHSSKMIESAYGVTE